MLKSPDCGVPCGGQGNYPLPRWLIPKSAPSGPFNNDIDEM